MLRRLLVKVLRDADGVPGGTPPADGGTPPADGGTPPAPDDNEPKVVPLKALTETQRKLSEAKEELAYLRGMQAATPPAPAAPAPKPTAPVEPVEPNIDDFGDDFAAFQAADRQYIIDRAEFNALRKFEQQQSSRTQQDVIQSQIKEFNKRLEKAAELDPELKDIAMTFHLPGPNHIPLTPLMQDAIRESDVGPQLLRHFANNKAEVAQLAGLNPTDALRRIGRIEATIVNKQPTPVKHVTSAPEPVKPVGSGAPPDIDEDKMPMSDYLARERQKKDALRQKSQRR